MKVISHHYQIINLEKKSSQLSFKKKKRFLYLGYKFNQDLNENNSFKLFFAYLLLS
jgi:hypothetical protein